MVRLEPDGTMLAMSQGTSYNWHKSIGLVAVTLAAFRLMARWTGRLPDWRRRSADASAPLFTANEQLLHTAMFVQPIAGFVYAMAGGYGVRLFGVVDLAHRIGEWPALATGAKWVHIVGSYVLLDRLLHRMLPRRRGDG
jgi:cytochrome b561